MLQIWLVSQCFSWSVATGQEESTEAAKPAFEASFTSEPSAPQEPEVSELPEAPNKRYKSPSGRSEDKLLESCPATDPEAAPPSASAFSAETP